MLGREEIESALADLGELDIDCDFCGQKYAFDAVDCAQLFTTDMLADAVQPPGRQQQWRVRSGPYASIAEADAALAPRTMSTPVAMSGRRRPMLSDIAPTMNVPSAIPIVVVARPSCTVAALVPKSLAIAGSAGRYRSIAIGPRIPMNPSQNRIVLVRAGEAPADPV